MTDDTCIATKNNGEPCEYAAKYSDGKCGIHSDENGSTQGAPTKFNDERREECLDAAREGKSQAGCARAAGVDESTLRGWLEENASFSRAFARARAEGESMLVRDGLTNPDVDSSMAKFLLASSFDYKKKEKQEHEHSGEGGGPIQVDINETVVTTSYSEESE